MRSCIVETICPHCGACIEEEIEENDEEVICRTCGELVTVTDEMMSPKMRNNASAF